MPTTDTNLADRSGSLVESHRGYDPRIVFFYFVLAALFITLVVGLAYRQLSKSSDYADAERQQTQRRILFPGSRGNILDRNGTLLVGNHARFEVVLQLDELKAELRREHIRINKNYLAAGERKDAPTYSQIERIARVSLVQRYLDQVNKILKRDEKVDARALNAHFHRQLLLPYTLLDGLQNSEAARLLEGLPVNSPLQVYAAPTRTYPFGSTAAHTLGFVRPDNEVEAKDFPGEDLTTFRMKGVSGKDGLEKWFDAHLQGEAGGRIIRVDHRGYKIRSSLAERKPKQGKALTTSLDIDLQLIAEEAIGDQTGAAVALDVNTGEVLVMASKPDYDLNKFSPRATQEIVNDINQRGAWVNVALNGSFPPGSTFKILTSIAGLHRNVLTPEKPIEHCNRWLRVGNSDKPCYNGREAHGDILLREAIAESCDIYYYRLGLMLTPEVLAAEARRMGFGKHTGIELPNEVARLIVPDPDWMRRERGIRWYDGETTNVAIGQGALSVSPLQMACFAASVARREIFTQPTLLHQPNRPRQRHDPIGLTSAQYQAVLEGMVGCTTYGTAKTLTQTEAVRVPVSVAGKTGTAQIPDKKNIAWFICFAPAEKPEVAMAVAIVGDTSGEEFGGGRYAAPIAGAVLKKYFEKKANPTKAITSPLRSE